METAQATAGQKTFKSALLEFYQEKGVAPKNIKFTVEACGSVNAPEYSCRLLLPGLATFKAQVYQVSWERVSMRLNLLQLSKIMYLRHSLKLDFRSSKALAGVKRQRNIMQPAELWIYCLRQGFLRRQGQLALNATNSIWDVPQSQTFPLLTCPA